MSMQRLENGRFEHLDTQAGLAPVPSLSVVAESEELANGFVVSSVSREDILCGFGGKLWKGFRGSRVSRTGVAWG